MENPDTAAIDLALEAAGDMEDGFAIADVAHVEARWSSVDVDLATYGFLLQLTDGTRRQIELTFDAMSASQEEVDIVMYDLGTSTDLPVLEGAHWSTDVDHLNARLAILKLQ